jgi:predicted transcriptional regulator
MVKTEIGEVELSAGEWKKVREGIREIEQGRFATFEEMKRDLARRKLAHKQNR